MSNPGVPEAFEGRSVYERVISVMLDFSEVEDLDKTIHPDFMGYGSAAHEFFRTREDVKKMAEMQAEQLKGGDFRYTRAPVSEKIFAGGDACLILENCQLFLPGSNHKLQVRLSVLLEKIDGKWLVTHFHGSSPDTDIAEDEAFPEEGLRRKNQELEAKIKERTRELEVEAALERVRTVSMAMQNPSGLSSLTKVIFTELKGLGLEDLRNSEVIINTDSRETITSYYYSDYGVTGIVKLDYKSNAIVADWARRLKKAEDAFAEVLISEAQMAEWREYRQSLGYLPDPKLDTAQTLHYYSYSIGLGALSISSFSPISGEQLRILQRFRNVFKLSYQRYTEIARAEAQLRASQIEAALERTRTQSMLMQHSRELNEVSSVFHEQLLLLGIDSEFSFVWLPSESREDHLFWTTWTETVNGKSVFHSKSIRYPLDLSDPYNATCIADWESGVSVYEHFVPPKDIANFLASWEEMLEGASHLKAEFFPEGIYYTEAFMKYGCFGIDIRRPLTDEEKPILHRFAIEFERTYTRFLDLQKAEVRAREAQIETALEKVRTHTMGMRSSEDLSQVTSILFEEMKNLGGDLFAFGIVLCDKDQNVVEQWHSLADKGMISPFRVPVDLDYIHQYRYDQWKSGKDLFSIEIPEDYIQEHFDKMYTLPSFKKAMEEVASKGYDVTIPSWEVDYGASFTHGYPLVSSAAPFQESHIFPRFANVFEQAYTRFLDLQTAEAQAREAQIEASLERLRSASMAMQQTEDISEVTIVFLDQLRELNLNFIQAWINVFHLDEGFFDIWFSPLEGVYKEPTHLQLPSVLFEDTTFKSWKAGHAFSHLKLHSKEEVDALVKACDKATDTTYFSHFQEKLQLERLEFLDANYKYGTISISGYEKATEEEKATLYRFAKVFEQTYTRFLDLQKAEAQARESRIEAALERVRSRTMGMQHSDELAEASHLLDKEVRGLGIKTWGCAFNIYREEDSIEWFGNESGLLPTYTVPREGIFRQYYDWGQKGESLFIKEIAGEECIAHYEFMSTLPVVGDVLRQLKARNGSFPSYQVDHVAYFKYGYLLFITKEAVPEAHDIFKRFANVFEQTYTRFLDLQLKEEQAVKLVSEKQRLEKTLSDLQATQKQLIHAEKMASLGELTAGIAHEIQNPLNFVNNFSEVSRELLVELMEELKKGDTEEVDAITHDVIQNLEKVLHHGKRAESIVKGMLQHSRSGDGKKEPTDLNALADEYFRLAYHGLRAKDKAFNANMETDFEKELPLVNVVPQDIGRVLLNLFTNAFHAISDRKKTEPGSYVPTVWVKIRKSANEVKITVEDNGGGIPRNIREKIFQPFFTTKPTGEGTGLGLSMSYDIVTKGHGGGVTVESADGEGATFTVTLPVDTYPNQ